MSDNIRTRFAPSPTGYLHIGGARTALFNYLLARRHGGRFVLRIEDTDQTRNIEAADQKLLDDLRWLGIEWDEGPGAGGAYGPYYQSQRLARYREVARALMERGLAYYAMETREELDAMRQAAQARGEKGFRYPRPKTFPTEAEAEQARAEGRPVVVRFKMPERNFVIEDKILGRVEVGASELSDFVIMKGDGWPTYHFAVVIDDADMRITHVLRGQEHLLNSVNHMALQEALGFPTPTYAHLPIIFNAQGAKMSKREKDKAVREAVKAADIADERARAISGASEETYAAWRQGKTQLEGEQLQRLARELDVQLPEIDIHDFRKSGYLPEVLVNFIALLGWASGDDREKYALEELCQVFSVERVGKTNARFDREKLLAFNTQGVEAASTARKLEALRDYLAVNPESPLCGLDDETLRRLIELCKGFRTFPDIETKCGALFAADTVLDYDEKAVKKWLLKGDQQGLTVLRELRERLAALEDWTVPRLEETLRQYAEQRELGLGKVAQPLRIALTGTTVSPQIADTLDLVGRERTLRRIERALAEVRPE